MKIFPLVVVLLSLCFASAEEVDVYLLGGQSNMQGIGKIKNLSEQVHGSVKNVSFFRGGSFVPLVVGKTQTSHRVGEFGPEVGFALALGAQRPTYLIKYAASGMPLHPGWNGNRWVNAEPSPNRVNFYAGESSDDPNQGKLYKAMIRRFNAGLKALRDQGHTPVVRGFLWMQGEQDSKHAVSAKSYATQLKLLRDRLAQDVGAQRLPMVFGQVLPYEKAMPRFTHRSEIRTSMAAADMHSGNPEAIALTRMVSTDDCPLLKDTVHYNAEGQLKLGTKMAKAMKVLLENKKKVFLWPKDVPGFPERYQHKPFAQQDPERISETSRPFMRIFPAVGKPTGQAMVIFPGGGYRILADKKEGDRVAAHFAARGITCFVACYRVTRKNHPGYRYPGPLMDARQAIRLAKKSAKKYGFNPDRVGVMGFSAGGHLAAMCATQYDDQFEGELNTDVSVRPAFAALIYPVASMVAPRSHSGSRRALLGPKPTPKMLENASPERRIKKGAPPLFIAHNQFDPVDAMLSLELARAATRVKVPCELHLFPVGGHGFGMGRPGDMEKKNPGIAWVKLLENFLKR